MQFSLLQVSVRRTTFKPGVVPDLSPGPAHHRHLVGGALEEEPPAVEVLHHRPVTEDISVPDTL